MKSDIFFLTDARVSEEKRDERHGRGVSGYLKIQREGKKEELREQLKNVQ